MSSPRHNHDSEPRRPRRRPIRRAGERLGQFTYIGIWVFLFLTAGFVSSGATFVPFFNHGTDGPRQPEAEILPPAPKRIQEAGLMLPAKVVGEQVRPAVNGAYPEMFWAGVNLGSSVPGQEPGAVAATREDYDRWFAEMGELGVTVVRIYTILSPSFYDALRDYNLRHAAAPIYVLHGVWIPEDRFYETDNIWDPEVVAEMKAELRDAVGAVHGDASIGHVPGHASGIYRSDISPWMLGWSFGIEWDPEASQSTLDKNKGMTPPPARYIKAKRGANPMEIWIATNLDYIATLEAERGWSVPLTFTNWDTTDPLRHPDEPLFSEDLVSIDATHLEATAKWPAGYFASFHAYPYYPDFLRWQKSYQDYRRPRDGKIDPYAGYIHDLKQHHKGMALMVTEFGQPTSLGCAHLAPLGRDQGCHSEQEAAAHVVDMMNDLKDEGLAGGIVFMWLDEWFKFTWNTIDYELPGGHRALWRNVFTNEEHFGLIAAEPGPEDLVVLDGKDGEWADLSPIGSGSGSVKSVTATSDAENVYLRLKVTPELWRQKRIVIGLDVHPEGNGGLPGRPGVDADAEMAVVIEPGKGARMFHAAWREPLGVRFGGFANPQKNYFPTKRADIEPGSGAWIPLRQILNYPYLLPSTGRMNPTEWRDASHMPWGTTDTASAAFDDRNLLMGAGDTMEIALPWGMMTFADPSSHRIFELHLDPDAKKQVTTRKVTRLGISVMADGEPLLATKGYTWAGWDTVEWHERKKAGWPILKRAYTEYKGPFRR